MRVFKKYAPRQIANYVVSFFKGTFELEGHGIFEFDSGRVITTVQMNERMIRICREINSQANLMSNKIAVVQYT